ncbi:Putative serine/threonine-protein kinase, active [Septoria linicola]|uniref:non-specific serine/threonine protein kinase n=1 Tax=Septoria linicola TaxID=215465 RepID=A0A9Q9AML7_9PEZI|nr:putative serine/threonine-protein kinase, active [Septoria linicola]USW52252.1 Putative serine/threonine-protein kinase, active [Septoria linicola]
MATDDKQWRTFEKYLEAGLDESDLTDDEKEWCREEAETIWEETSAVKRTQFVALIDQFNEAKAICIEAEIIYSSQNSEGGFDGKIGPIITQRISDISNEEVNIVQGYRRVINAFDASLSAVMATLTNLLAVFPQLKLDKICEPAAQQFQNSVAAKGMAIEPHRDWLDKYCVKPEFVARAEAARPADTPTVAVNATGTKMWVQTIDIGGSDKEGKLCLWLGYDEEGGLVDRYINKIEGRSKTDPSMAGYWRPDGQGSKFPLEWWLQNKCWAKDRQNFVRIRDYTYDDQLGNIHYKIEYCPFGDLFDYLDRYTAADLSIPEPMLWYIFHKLAEQCLIMQRGSHIAQTAAWLEIVHRDIKLDNIFIDVPTPGFFPAYPTPKLADFGFAFETHKNDLNNPIWYWQAGTYPYMAPEQVVQLRRDKKIVVIPESPPCEPAAELQPMLAYTNIWAIGMCMLQLVSPQRIRSDEQLLYEDEQPAEHAIAEWSKSAYSKALLDLIEECMRFWPKERITPEELLKEIKAEMVEVTGGVGEYCKNAAVGLQPDGGDFEWQRPREKYKLKLAADGGVGQGLAGLSLAG